jgi:hypothetical protein
LEIELEWIPMANLVKTGPPIQKLLPGNREIHMDMRMPLTSL